VIRAHATGWRALIAVALALAAAVALVACGGGGHATGATDPPATTTTTSTTATAATAARGSGPLAGFKLWINPYSPAAVQAQIWRRDGSKQDAALVSRIAAQPTFKWLTGGSQPAQQVAASFVDRAQRAQAVAQLVLYNIPDRDCHGLSGGGAADAPAYLEWVRQVMAGIGDHRVIIILEPDAIDQAASGCLSADDAHERYGMLANATKLIERDTQARVYLDAGSAGWLAPKQIAQPMYLSGISQDAGFSLNVSNFYSTAQSIAYGRELSKLVGGKHFVIDTSRNGNGAPPGGPGVNEWCNPPGRALGHPPTTNTGVAGVDAFLWVKYPGQSDGSCRAGEPPAGTWWPSYALSLVRDTPR
jgi:endoglucanase